MGGAGIARKIAAVRYAERLPPPEDAKPNITSSGSEVANGDGCWCEIWIDLKGLPIGPYCCMRGMAVQPNPWKMKSNRMTGRRHMTEAIPGSKPGVKSALGSTYQ